MKPSPQVPFCMLLSDYAHRTEVKMKLVHILCKEVKVAVLRAQFFLSIRRNFKKFFKVQAVITEASTTKKMYLHSPLRACVLQNKSGVLVRTAAFRTDADFKWTPDGKNCMHTHKLLSVVLPGLYVSWRAIPMELLLFIKTSCPLPRWVVKAWVKFPKD